MKNILLPFALSFCCFFTGPVAQAQTTDEPQSFKLEINIEEDFEFKFNTEALSSMGEGLKALAIAEGYELDDGDFNIKTIKGKQYLNGQELSPEFLEKMADYIAEKCKAFANDNKQNWNIQID